MKRFSNVGRKILFSLVLTILAVAMIFTGCKSPASNNNGDDQPKPQATMVSISVSGQKSAFEYGEEFSTEGLVVTANLSDNTKKTLSASEYTVDSSTYDKLVPNVYTVYVSAVNVNLHTTYAVTVGDREILPVPTDASAVYAYNSMDAEFNDDILNYYDSYDTPDPTWEGRYTVSVFTPDDEENAQEVGVLAAFSALFSSEGGFTSFGMFDFNGSVTVRITTNFYFETVDIRPFSLNIEYYRVDGMENTIEFLLTRPCNISVEFDGDTLKNLMLFSDSMSEYSRPSARFVQAVEGSVTDKDNLIIVEPGELDVIALQEKYSETKHNVIVFGEGIYNTKNGPSGRLGSGDVVFPSNSTVYIHGDAAIYGFVNLYDVNNVVIKGRGIISGHANGNTIIFDTQRSSNIVVQGIVLKHSINWTNRLLDSQGIVYRNVRVCGSAHNNNDGFDICSSTDVLVDGCFIRTIDDAITIKGYQTSTSRSLVENILIQNTVVWNYQGGNAIAVGSESIADWYNNIVYRDIDIIHNTTNRAIMIELLDGAEVSNVSFDDIRIELDSTFSNVGRHYTYSSDWDNNAWLVMLEIMSNDEAFYGTETDPGSLKDVTFNNIIYNGNSARKIAIFGIDEEHDIKNVAFNNFNYNGTVLNEYNFDDYLDVEASKYYSNITFDDATDSSYTSGNMVDDAEVETSATSLIRKVVLSDESAFGGSYTNYCVRYTNGIDVQFDAADTGYTVPAIRFKQSTLGGMFEVKLDGKVVGLMDTYSENEAFTTYYLPWQFLTEGEHKLTFTAKYLPQEEFNTYTLDFNLDGIELIDGGNNFIEFEGLKSTSTVEKDDRAHGGFVVEFNKAIGDEVSFAGYGLKERYGRLYLTYLAGPDKGVYRFYLNDNLISKDIDMYSPIEEFKTVEMDVARFEVGEYKLTVKCVGKNNSSNNTNCVLDNVGLKFLPKSTTWKAGGSNGSSVAPILSSGVTFQRENLQPYTFGNITTGSTIYIPAIAKARVAGVYDFHLYVNNYDAQCFNVYIEEKLIETEFENGILTFRYVGVPNSFGIKFEYLGLQTCSFQFIKAVADPVAIDKSELRLLIQMEDDRIVAENVPKYLKDNYYLTLEGAKTVLFDAVADDIQVANAIEALQVATAKLTDSEARYNLATLSDCEVEVAFEEGNPGDLAILYLNDNVGVATEYYAIIAESGKATFMVEDKYVGQEVKLYCEVVGSPLAGATIQQGDKITSALEFIFSEDYWTADVVESFYFESLRETSQLTVTFDEDTVQAGEIAMLAFRNLLNDDLGVFYAKIDADGTATFNVTELEHRDNVYAIARVSLNDEALVKAMQVDTAVVASANVNNVLMGTEDSERVTITSSLGARKVDEDGIHYVRAGGYVETNVKILYAGDFDYVVFDWSLTVYCGAGEEDKVFVYSSDGVNSLTSFRQSVTNGNTNAVTKTGTTKLTSQECGSGIVLKIWVGCYGDNIQCKSSAPHGDETLKISNVKFYNASVGEVKDLKLLGDNPIVTPTTFTESKQFDSLNGVSELTVEGLNAANDTQVTAVIQDENGAQKGSYTATVAAGTATFTISDFAYDGKVKVFLQTQDGTYIVATDMTAKVTRSLHLGKLFATQGTVDGWKATELNGGLNINADGIIYNDTSKIYSANWRQADPNGHIGVYGYDYSFEWLGSIVDLQSISIDYKFTKVCNCGGGDQFKLYNGTIMVGNHSCQDQNNGVYETTINIDKSSIDKLTSNTFNLFYWMGCQKSNSDHVNEQMEFGTMTYTMLMSGETALEVVTA